MREKRLANDLYHKIKVIYKSSESRERITEQPAIPLEEEYTGTDQIPNLIDSTQRVAFFITLQCPTPLRFRPITPRMINANEPILSTEIGSLNQRIPIVAISAVPTADQIA